MSTLPAELDLEHVFRSLFPRVVKSERLHSEHKVSFVSAVPKGGGTVLEVAQPVKDLSSGSQMPHTKLGVAACAQCLGRGGQRQMDP